MNAPAISPGWTEERITVLRRSWIAGRSASFIAKELGGVTRNAVIGKLARLGLTRDSGEVRQAPSKPARASVETPVRRRPTAPAAPPRKPPPKPPAPVHKPAAAIKGLVEEWIAEAEPRPAAEPIPLLEHRFGQCRWPMNSPPRGFMEQLLYCGEAVRDEACPYCRAHAKIAFRKFEDKPRRKPPTMGPASLRLMSVAQ